MAFRPFKAYTAPSRETEYPPVPEVADETPVGIELEDAVTEDTEYRETLDFPDEVEPQPVVIVQPNAEKPYVNHGFFQLFYLFNDEPVKVVSNYYGHRRIFMRNTSDADCFLSGNNNVNVPTSFELSPGAEMILHTTDEIWAWAKGTRLTIYVEIEG